MCIAGGGSPAQQPSPGQVTASGLQLGTTEIERNQANVLGRLALTANKTPNPADTTPTTSAVPGGTLGAAPGASPVTGGGGARSPFSLGYSGSFISAASKAAR